MVATYVVYSGYFLSAFGCIYLVMVSTTASLVRGMQGSLLVLIWGISLGCVAVQTNLVVLVW